MVYYNKMKSESHFLVYSIAIIILVFGCFLILLPSLIYVIYSEVEGEFEGDLSIIDTRIVPCDEEFGFSCTIIYTELYIFSGGLSLGVSSPTIGNIYFPSPNKSTWANCEFSTYAYSANGQLIGEYHEKAVPFLAYDPHDPGPKPDPRESLILDGSLTIQENLSPSISSNNISSMAIPDDGNIGYFDFRTQPFLLVCDDDLISNVGDDSPNTFTLKKQTDGTLTASGGSSIVIDPPDTSDTYEYKSNWKLKLKSTNCRTSPVFNFLQAKSVQVPFTANTLQEALPNLLKAISNAQIQNGEPGSGLALAATVVPFTDKDREMDGNIIKCIRNYEIQIITLIPQWTNVNQFCTKVQEQWNKDRNTIINHEKRHADDNAALVKKFLDKGKFTFPKPNDQYIKDKIQFYQLRSLNKIIEHATFQPGTEFNADRVKC
jgi:hypothetical protein